MQDINITANVTVTALQRPILVIVALTQSIFGFAKTRRRKVRSLRRQSRDPTNRRSAEADRPIVKP